MYTNITWDKNTFNKLLLDVAKALMIFHQNGIIHGDTTPDNVGYRKYDDNFVLFDFGDTEVTNGLDYELYLRDVNRFLNSILRTYQKFFKDYIHNVIKIRKLVNDGEYNIGKFYNSVNEPIIY